MQHFAKAGALTGGRSRDESVERASRSITEWTLEFLGTAQGIEVPPQALAVLDGGRAVQVPGSVHTDLLDAGAIRDITVDGVESEDLWIAHSRWRYRTRIEPPTAPFTQAVVTFEGIDTVGTVLVDGEPRRQVRDMFRTHEIDVTRELLNGPVTIDVELDSALRTAQAAEDLNPLPRPDIYPMPYNQVRKMACSFGWDWGPATVTAGLWRPVTLTTWNNARLEDVRVSTRATHAPTLSVATRIAGRASTLRVRLTGPVGPAGTRMDTEVEGSVGLDGTTAELELHVPAVQVWNPVGLGQQPLYDVEIEVLSATNDVLDRCSRRVGFRQVELAQVPDEAGTSCELLVNGQRVWVRGLNWIPDDPFPHRIDRERLRTRIGQAVATGANLLRVWGGGVFESEDFYDLCDEMGVLVWQDFLFACAAYPEDEQTKAEITAEVEDNVRRLRHRACLAVWAGCNENLWAFQDWGWQEVLAGRPWGLYYYTDLLPRIVGDLDGTRPYVPGSPFSPGSQHPNDPAAGSMHLWDVWNDLDWTAYADHTPRFAAEFGWQSSAAWPTIVRAVGGSEHVQVTDPALELHQKAGDGTAKLSRGLGWHLPTAPTGSVEWVYATQLVQAGAVRFGMSHLRSAHDVCSGAVWWQHNDIWPAISWSLVDVAGRRKLAWYAMREVFAPRAALLTGGRNDAVVTLVNDAPEEWTTQVSIRVVHHDGTCGAQTAVPAVVGALGHLRLEAPRILPAGSLEEAAGAELIVVEVDGERSVLWLSGDLQLKLPEHDVQVDRVLPHADGVRVEVTARSLVKDLCLLADVEAPDAEVDRQLLTLLAGEQAVFTVSGIADGQVPAEHWAGLLWSQASLLS